MLPGLGSGCWLRGVWSFFPFALLQLLHGSHCLPRPPVGKRILPSRMGVQCKTDKLLKLLAPSPLPSIPIPFLHPKSLSISLTGCDGRGQGRAAYFPSP